jgi:hypothetical protein
MKDLKHNGFTKVSHFKHIINFMKYLKVYETIKFHTPNLFMLNY